MKKHDNDSMNYDENGYYSDESDKNSGFADKLNKIFGIITIIWFSVSVILMIVLSHSEREDKTWLIVILFFQVFAVLGILSIISELVTKGRFQKGLLLLVATGVGGCTISYVIHSTEGEQRDKFLKILAVCFPLLFTAAGIYNIFSSLRTKYHTKNVCTEYVSAKCVDISTISTTINGKTTYKYVPTYEYEYDNENYTSSAYKTPEQRTVGDNYEILVNPDKPKEIYDPTSVDDSMVSIVLTALFLVLLPTAISFICVYFLFINP